MKEDMKVIIATTVMEMVNEVNKKQIKKDQIVSFFQKGETLYLLYY